MAQGSQQVLATDAENVRKQKCQKAKGEFGDVIEAGGAVVMFAVQTKQNKKTD